MVKSNGDAEEAADLAKDLQYDFSGSKRIFKYVYYKTDTFAFHWRTLGAYR